jgi:predicted nucleic acid-binding protein
VVKALFDTNILIDYLNAIPEAAAELQLYEDRAISIITWMEVMVGAEDRLSKATRAFLDGFTTVELRSDVADKAVQLRRSHRIKLPDAIIWATALVDGRLLVTRNTKDFPSASPGIRTPYLVATM